MYRVIIADDQKEALDWLRSLLAGYDDFKIVGEAESGSDAISLVTELTPDLVIADVDMPGQNGLDVTRYIGDNLPQTKVVLVSGHAEREYERLAAEEGAIAFIPKARFSVDALRQALQQGI